MLIAQWKYVYLEYNFSNVKCFILFIDCRLVLLHKFFNTLLVGSWVVECTKILPSQQADWFLGSSVIL